jgi:hypothetical protein
MACTEVTVLHTFVINLDRSVDALLWLAALSRPRHNPYTFSAHHNLGYVDPRPSETLSASTIVHISACRDSKIGPGARMWFFPGPGRFARERADIPLMSPIFSSELLGNSKRRMCSRSKMRSHPRTFPEGVILDGMFLIHPCIPNGTLSLRNRASGTVNVFLCFRASREVFRVCSPGQSPEKGAL